MQNTLTFKYCPFRTRVLPTIWFGMFCSKTSTLSLIVWLVLLGCSDLQRDNPVVPVAGAATETTSIDLVLPLSKILLSVVHRVEAILVSAEQDSVVKELNISPLGPATGTIGAILPSNGYILSVVGYDLDGNELFRGHQENITIIAGDTTAVAIELVLTQTESTPVPSKESDESGQQQPPDDGEDSSGNGNQEEDGEDSGSDDTK